LEPYVYLLIGVFGLITAVYAGKTAAVLPIARFAYPNARLTAKGNPFVTRDGLGALLDSRDLQEALSLVHGEEYPVQGLGSSRDVDAALATALVRAVEEVETEVPAIIKPLFDALLLRMEAQQVKVLLREKRHGATPEELAGKVLTVGRVTPELVQAVSNAEDAPALAEALSDFGSELAEALALKDDTGFAAERTLDRLFYDVLQSAPEACGKAVRSQVKEFAGNYLDVINVKAIIRAKRAGLGPEETGRLLAPSGRSISSWLLESLCQAESVEEAVTLLEGTSVHLHLREGLPAFEETGDAYPLEAAVDRHLLQIVSDFSLKEFGLAGPSVRYIITKELEIRNLKAIFRGMGEGWSADEIRPMLVEEASR